MADRMEVRAIVDGQQLVIIEAWSLSEAELQGARVVRNLRREGNTVEGVGIWCCPDDGSEPYHEKHLVVP